MKLKIKLTFFFILADNVKPKHENETALWTFLITHYFSLLQIVIMAGRLQAFY